MSNLIFRWKLLNMYLIKEYKDTIVKVLKDIQLYTTFSNKAGHFDINKDAEEFYRGLLNLFYDWDLEPLNTAKNPNYEGADLGDASKHIAVQVTSENDSDKVHHSIKGFINSCLPVGYETLYVLMFKGKGEFPKADFAKSVDKKFVFDRKTHIIDTGNLSDKLKDIKFDKLKAIYDYLESTVGFVEKDKQKIHARFMLAKHADYQRSLYEESPVLRISPFALKHVYIETDCSELTWADVKDKNRTENPFNIKTEDRKPLLETVMRLIKSKELENAIIIQGIAGSGKSSFTLRLCNELLEKGLSPICIRIGELTFDTHIKDALPKAVRFSAEDTERDDNLFLNDEIFAEKGTGEFEHISKYVLILDGWDEISQSDEGFKKKVAKMLDELNATYLMNKRPRVRVILTGRPSVDIGNTNSLREKSPFLNLLKLTPEQLENYVGKIIAAVNSNPPMIEPNKLTEFWKVGNYKRFQTVFKQYEREFKDKGTKLEVLGLPLLTYLTVRLVSEWHGDLSPLLENQTTLYRHLIDLTCKNAARIDSPVESKDQHKLYGDDLRELLRQTASAITICSGENISQKELSLRFELEGDELNDKAIEMQKTSKLSALLISFYFKGGHTHLGCEFAHKSFREFFFAEAIVETLKQYGREQKETPPQRENYWEDFAEHNPNDNRFKLSRNLSELLSPQWLTPEVKNHLREILIWEITRSIKPNGKKPIGTPTEAITLEQWQQIRTGLADLWEWWGEGVHTRPQSRRVKGIETIEPAYVNELIELAAPRVRDNFREYVRTSTIDAHLGDGLFELCAIVHDKLVHHLIETDREYQSINDDKPKKRLMFKPTGENIYYFQNYIARINSAGWRIELDFQNGPYCHQLDLNKTYIPLTNFHRTTFEFANCERASFRGANLKHAIFYGANLKHANLQDANLQDANLQDANFRYANLQDVNLQDANLQDANLNNTNLKGANLQDVNLQSANLTVNFDYLGRDFLNRLKTAKFESIYLDDKLMSRYKAFAYLKRKLENHKRYYKKMSKHQVF
jgi:GTPase SAR1 family protein